ncbi:MAG: hypothetical protein ACPGJS_02410 [Flammeovirgaceae bacterium]
MNKLYYFLLLVITLACQNKQNELATPTQATVVGATNVSSALPEFATTVNAAQNEIYFNRTSADRAVMQIMHAQLIDGNWSTTLALPFSTGEFRDVDPFLSTDGKRLYFSSTRPVPQTGQTGIFNTWYVNQVDGDWSDPIYAPYPLNSDSTEIFVTLAENGNAYFVTERNGDRGIVVSRYQNDRYQEPEKIVLKLQGEVVYASNPCISSDERFLIVTAWDPQGPRNPDLFVAWNQNGSWTELQNLGSNVNTAHAEFAPGLSKDNKTLYFTSERPGIVGAPTDEARPPGDIYVVNLAPILDQLK